MATDNSAQRVVSTRISSELGECITQSLRAGETASNFMADAIANEVSRRKLCKPPRKVTGEQLEDKLEVIHSSNAVIDEKCNLLDAKLDLLLKANGLTF